MHINIYIYVYVLLIHTHTYSPHVLPLITCRVISCLVVVGCCWVRARIYFNIAAQFILIGIILFVFMFIHYAD